MPVPPARRRTADLVVVGLTLLASAVAAQPIQRCESPDGRVSYSNSECPAGTRNARALPQATQPSPEQQREARERLQRDQAAATALAARRQPVPATVARSQGYVPVDEARRAADCAYLRAELDSNRRLRNVLTTRRYYSTEDVEQMDAREAELVADYRRFCSR
jgi:hypothetical protein